MRVQSPIFNIMRGSVAGTTYTANQFHQIIGRARTAPVQPNTNFQSTIRTALAEASSRWRAMSDAARHFWYTYGLGVYYEGPLGPYRPGGRLLFVGQWALRRYLFARGLHPDPPLSFWPIWPGRLNVLISVGIFTTPAETGITVHIDNPGPEKITAFINISHAMDGTVNFWKGPYNTRDAKAIDVPPGDTDDISFNGLVNLKYYHTRTSCVGVPDGEATPPYGSRLSQEHFLRHQAFTVIPKSKSIAANKKT